MRLTAMCSMHLSPRSFISNLFATSHNFIQAFEFDIFCFFWIFHFDPGWPIFWSSTFYSVGQNRHFFLESCWCWWPGAHLWSTFFTSNWTTGKQRFLPLGLSTWPFPPVIFFLSPFSSLSHVGNALLFSSPVYKVGYNRAFLGCWKWSAGFESETFVERQKVIVGELFCFYKKEGFELVKERDRKFASRSFTNSNPSFL